jgi:hypothetical protein
MSTAEAKPATGAEQKSAIGCSVVDMQRAPRGPLHIGCSVGSGGEDLAGVRIDGQAGIAGELAAPSGLG